MRMAPRTELEPVTSCNIRRMAKLTVMRSTDASFEEYPGAPTRVSEDKTIDYRFIEAKATKQGVIGVSEPNDA